MAMGCEATRASTLHYQDRWGTLPMFANFKGRGFDLGSSQIRLPGGSRRWCCRWPWR